MPNRTGSFFVCPLVFVLAGSVRPGDIHYMTFEASLNRLEEILAALEQPQVGLDASLKLFEEGIELLRTASAELGKAETKVKMLLERADGGFELREMDL